MLKGKTWRVEFDPAVSSAFCKTRPGDIVSNNSANRNLAYVIVVNLTNNSDRFYPGDARVSVAG